MKKLEELGISPLPWTAHGHWVDFAGGFLSTGETGSGYEDARLIAAAPELYEALQLCLDKMCVRCYAASHAITGSVPCEEGCDVYKKAKDALWKAAGEEAK